MKRRIDIEKDILRKLMSRANIIVNEFRNDPFTTNRDYYKAVNNKVRINKPIARDIVILLRMEGKIKKKKPIRI